MEYQQILLRDVNDAVKEAGTLLKQPSLSVEQIAKLEETLHNACRDVACLYGVVVSKQYRSK